MNRRNPLIILFVMVMIIAGFPLLADSSGITSAGSDHGKSIEMILTEIREELGLGKNQSINPDMVSDKLLEELGEAVMGYMIPNERQHEWMDNMMGGEGSESLANMHRILGYRYLRNGGIEGIGFGPMMMGWSNYGGEGMMNYRGWMNGWNNNYYGWIFMAILIGLIALIIFLVVSLLRRRNIGYSYDNDALEILKSRYAKGEISKEEYLERRRDIEGG